ncbi:MAG TPA: hypothetical protein VGR71_04300 [Nitrospira sp.]|nr:hypothetical protein [Nitrospira sp.]
MNRNRMMLLRVVVLAFFLAGLAAWHGDPPVTVFAQPGCPAAPVVTIDSPQTPTDVCIPPGFGGNPIQFFDDYSWRTFISMVWPVAAGQRGVPDTTRKIGDTSVPLVFETLKSDWEVFQPSGAAPSPWNEQTGANPCGTAIGFNDMMLASFTKFGNLGEAGSSRQNPLIHALPSQNGKWVRYLTAFNQSEYTQIVNGKLYLLASLQSASPVTFQNGALDVKSAWMDMTGIPDAQRSRYYTRSAMVLDPRTPTNPCTTITVGLVGLHIVQKTPSRPQWIWSTFEQVDNVPPTPGANGTFGFNDGKGTPSPLTLPPPQNKDPNGGFPPNSWASPTVYNVVRIKPIDSQGNGTPNTSTQATNAKYQQALSGTVWQFYQLVMTQWPLQLNPPNPIPPAQSGFPPNTFPGTNAVSAFSNTTLETWDQFSIGTGCMACHTLTQKNTDFLWSLEINAFDASKPNGALMALRKAKAVRAPRSEAERQLMALLKSAASNKLPPPNAKK